MNQEVFPGRCRRREGDGRANGGRNADSARAIEETLFRRRFRCKWNLVIAPPSRVGRALMLAVDADQRIVGADRNARSTLGLDDHRLAAGVSLWTIFDRSPSLFRRSNVETTA